MTPDMRAFAFLAAFLLTVSAAAADFGADVEPIFHERCYMCHGPANQMSGLRLDQKAAALKGGYSGAVIAPGDSGASKLVERISSGKAGFKMPPAGPALSPAQIAAVKAWIDAGAEWPERGPAPKLSDDQKTQWWSFQPLPDIDPPAVREEAWVRNPVDRFVLARLEKEGVKPSPEADKVTLARRVAFDLVGLPPKPKQLAAFLADGRPDAYERYVDELLRSPHYGERQAIEWLDVARYADSDGYERDPLRPHAWRWRQWAIEALNDDMPFDELTIEQLAGDLLPNPTLEQRVATGFLRNGIKNREAGVKNEEKRFEETIDRMSTVGTVWLGLTVGCAQCHDHKFDPISQKEFYQLYAVFGNAVERDIDAPLPGEFGSFLLAYPKYRAERERILAESGLKPHYDKWRAEMIETMDRPGVRTDWDFALTEWRATFDRSDWFMRAPESELSEMEADKRIDAFLSRLGPDIKKDEQLTACLEDTKKQLDHLADSVFPVRNLAYTMIERNEPVATHIALRGDWRAPGLEVEPTTPAVLPEMESSREPVRLRFARWLVDPENPLTARVTVNRLWQQLFGAGLVRTANDFGVQGAKPTHPKLLDWLARELVSRGWSRKAMLRLLVASAAYRQSSEDRPELSERDPNNDWLARQNRLRLPAELIRDNALAVSGLLNPAIGGKSVHPPQPEGVAELGYSKKVWPEDRGPDRYRRGMYIDIRRTSPYPFLITFDAPDTLTANVSRQRSNTPLQALNLLNDPVFLEAAQSLALRVAQERQDFPGRLDRMFRLALSRAPEAAEKDRTATYFELQKKIFSQEQGAAKKLAPLALPGVDQAELAAWTAVARGLMNLDEFIVRE
jgi:mono/diheme cytochrome c family protein